MQPMKRRTRPHSTLAGLLCIAALVGCGDSTGPRTGTAFGPVVTVGNGTARSYAVTNDGAPTELGIVLSQSALAGLPDALPATEYVLSLPTAAATTPFDHIALYWNPAGHDPEGIYNVPHFDIHFYLISPAERDAITPADPEFEAKAGRTPAPALIPAGYVPTPGAVPRMGAHWVDPASSELNGQPFTRTFIYGFYDGEMVFFEPMLTRSFLQSRPNETIAIPVAEQYAKPGYHPASYGIRYDAARGEYRILLGDFTRRE